MKITCISASARMQAASQAALNKRACPRCDSTSSDAAWSAAFAVLIGFPIGVCICWAVS